VAFLRQVQVKACDVAAQNLWDALVLPVRLIGAAAGMVHSLTHKTLWPLMAATLSNPRFSGPDFFTKVEVEKTRVSNLAADL
jgi:hypothetical protein